MNSFQDFSLVINFAGCQAHGVSHQSCLRKGCY